MTKKSHECFRVWKAMRQRCNSKTCLDYKNYGGRGISVSKDWIGFGGFDRFMADMGERPKGMMIERINNDGNYCKENCRWATRLEQNNNSRTTVKITFNGKTQSLSMWDRECGFCHGTIAFRLKNNWPIKLAMTTPAHTGNRIGKK